MHVLCCCVRMPMSAGCRWWEYFSKNWSLLSQILPWRLIFLFALSQILYCSMTTGCGLLIWRWIMPVMICSADRLRERRSLCFYEEELNWPVFWCRIWNRVSLPHPVADHAFVPLFSKSHDASPQLPNFVLTFLFSMKCTESDEEEPIKGKESQLQFSCFINQEVKYLATGLRLVCDFKNVCVCLICSVGMLTTLV